jgi:membrane protease YdiL (CAAX protease family)
MNKVFFSPDEHRLRAGWRLLLQLAIFMTFLLALGTLWGMARMLLGLTTTTGLAEAEALTAMAMTASLLIARKWLDRRSFISLGLLAGFAIGAIIITLVFAIELVSGWAKIAAPVWQPDGITLAALAAAAGLGIFILTGWQEELYFRGYLLQNLKDGLSLPWAILLSSLVFGLAHLTNPNSLLIGAVGTALAGLLMAYGYLRTRQLWLPIGLHIGWNFFEGVVFGFPVSGLATPTLLKTIVSGPQLLTGGAYGPEAGLVLLPALILGAILIRLYPSPTDPGKWTM